ncbi:hypothetical protein ACFPM3_18335 [Streptomyces coeruleoprunus]|uniref:Uncharacterized protein n=1 Tax=Streptomyces coeruleoprunus TaxID=285563 RepID=A0ABV9XGI6_9ACTN
MQALDPFFGRRLLIESLAVLAADAQAQVDWLVRHGVMADEIALDFDHAFRVAEAMMAEGRLASGVMADLQEIDVTFSRMSGGESADRWTRNALSTDDGWALARRLARRVLLAELGEWRQPLPGITVVR